MIWAILGTLFVLALTNRTSPVGGSQPLASGLPAKRRGGACCDTCADGDPCPTDVAKLMSGAITPREFQDRAVKTRREAAEAGTARHEASGIPNWVKSRA